MRLLPAFTLTTFAAASAMAVLSACGPEQMGDAGTDVPQPASGTQRHVVAFRYAPGVPPERIAAVTARFAALQDSIPGITAFEHGVNNSPEGLNKDITHVYLLTFADAAARDAYLPHPAHQRFVELLDGAVADAFVIDYLITD